MNFHTALLNKSGGATVFLGIETDVLHGRRFITAGSNGQRGSRREEIAFCNKFPPAVDEDGCVSHGRIALLKNDESKFSVIRSERTPGEDADKALVLISCEGDEEWSDLPGYLTRNYGALEVVISGKETKRSKGGKYQYFEESLVVMSLGSSMLINFMGDDSVYLLSFADPAKGPEIQFVDDIGDFGVTENDEIEFDDVGDE